MLRISGTLWEFRIIINANYVVIAPSSINQRDRTHADLSMGFRRRICQWMLFDQISQWDG